EYAAVPLDGTEWWHGERASPGLYINTYPASFSQHPRSLDRISCSRAVSICNSAAPTISRSDLIAIAQRGTAEYREKEGSRVANFDDPYFRWNLRIDFRRHSAVIPERFARACAGRESFRGIHADHGSGRNVPSRPEPRTTQYRRGHSHVLHDPNGVAHCAARRRDN